jgi:hypothetical protein
VIAYRAQSYGGTINEALPARVRDVNALVSLLHYLEKTAFPLHLAAYYPYPRTLQLSDALISAVILTLLTVAVCRVGPRSLYLPVGWLWYLVAMLPVIGLVQIGSQSMADRYTYVSLVGLFVAVVWGADALREQLHLAPGALAALGAALLVGLGLLAHQQVMVWQNTRTLFTHAIAVTGGSSLAYVGLGTAEFEDGHLEAAAADFRTAKEFFPTTFQAPLHAGVVAEAEGHADEAEREYKDAIARAPRRSEPYLRLGSLYLTTGRPAEAMGSFETVLRLTPDNVEAQGLLEMARGRAAAKQRADRSQTSPGP